MPQDEAKSCAIPNFPSPPHRHARYIPCRRNTRTRQTLREEGEENAHSLRHLVPVPVVGHPIPTPPARPPPPSSRGGEASQSPVSATLAAAPPPSFRGCASPIALSPPPSPSIRRGGGSEVSETSDPGRRANSEVEAAGQAEPAAAGGATAEGRAGRPEDQLEPGETRGTTSWQPFSVSMGEFGGPEYQGLGEEGSRVDTFRKVSVLPLVFLIFYEVSGGPFGVEDSVQAAGPLLALVGFLVFPLIWSIPEALITAEMGTMFPENGGYVVWVSSALGPFWGFQQGWMKWLSGVIDNALYPVLFLDYLKSGIPALGGGLPRTFSVLGLTMALTYMNYRGLTIVGCVAVCLGVFSILPFIVMGFLAIPRLKPSRWLVVDIHNVDWNLYLNTLFWNLNYWDSISTLAGEVHNPKRTLPKALFYALILVVLAYFFPLLVGTGAIPLDRELWSDGYFSDIAKIIGGVWLRWWLQGASALSNMGMFVAEMSSDSFQLLGMAERGMLPEFFGKRSPYGTPLVGILFSASGVLLLSWLSFQEIVAAENFLYCFGMIMEFVAFIKLRITHPTAPRPYKIPLGTVGCILMIIPPTLLICVVLVLSSLKVMIVSIIALLIGFLLRPCLKYAEKRRWLKFSISSDLPDLRAAEHENATEALVA